jgi:UPF0755 protein
MTKRKLLIVFLIIGTVMMSSFSFYGYQILYAPNFQVEKGDRYLFIETGSDFGDVQKLVYDERYVNDPISFSFLSKLMDYDQLVRPGKYLVKSNSTNLEIIRMLRAGEQIPVNITFNNVRLLQELSEKICQNIELKPEEFDNYLFGQSVYDKYNFDQNTFPCMFIPNTYEVYWNISAEKLLERMNSEYNKFWNDNRKAKAQALNLSPNEVVTLASIVQAETKHYVESPIIAGLYLNRLKRGILLQADPTLVFAVGDFTIQRVLNVHKNVESPYNTYKYAGLPPGPINFPSIRSIDAVLNYEQHQYLYMCAKEDFSGYHNFASNLRDHLNNARKYQNALNRAQLYK